MRSDDELIKLLEKIAKELELIRKDLDYIKEYYMGRVAREIFRG